MRKKQFFKILFVLGLLVCISTSGWAQQQMSIRGTVTDNYGDPLPGVNIIIKGTSTGTVSDVEGNYSLEVGDPQNSVLVFKFIGFSDQEVPVNGRSNIDVTMEESSIGLDEVVAIG
jgi:hypothetical protein